MAGALPFFYALLLLLPVHWANAAATVTLSNEIDGSAHSCISKCLQYGYLDDMGDALACGTPYENECYCATAEKSASAAGAWMIKCASSRCAAGDFTRDLSSMESYYGSYCMAAGFTQPGATDWYTPAEQTEAPESTSAEEKTTAKPSQTADRDEPKETADSDEPDRTTRFTIVTQTTEPNGATRSRIIVQATSTLWVDSSGAPVKLDSSSSSGTSSGVKIGVGVAVPVVAILGGAFAWWFIRRRRRNKFVESNEPPEYTPPSETTQVSPPAHTASISRKPVASPAVSPVSQTNELSGTGVSRELSGREVSLAPSPSPPVALPGQHEMQGEGQHRPEMQGDMQHRPEMDGQGRVAEMTGETRPHELGQGQSPPPQYQHGGYVAPGQEQPRWELPDNSR